MYRYIRASKYDPDSVIDVTTTGTSYYDNFLNPHDLQYMEKSKNRTGEVVKMSPSGYYQECADKIFHTSVSNLMSQRSRDTESIDYLTKQIESGDKFDLPYINYAEAGQEGLHRMMVLGNLIGWNTKFPVLVVDYLDEHAEIVAEVSSELRKAISEAVEYSYTLDSLPQDLIDQIQYELDRRSVDDESEIKVKLVSDNDKLIVVSAVGFEDDIKYEIIKEYLNIREDSDDLELSDDDLEDLDDTDLLDLLFK